jgi:hypothetical protein
MASFFYMLTYQVELDDYIFFTAVELLNKSVAFNSSNYFYKIIFEDI